MPWPFTTAKAAPSTPKICALSLPEIRSMIRPHLDHPSLIACCQLNHAFYDDYISYVRWHTVFLGHQSRKVFPVYLLTEHETLIQRLYIEDTNVFLNGWLFKQCRNLRMLDLRVDSRRLDDDYGRNPEIREVGAQMMQLIQQNLNLEDLRINTQPMSMQHRNIMNRDLALLCSTSLMKLRLAESTMEISAINALIGQCPRLQELWLEGYHFSSWGGRQVVLELKNVRKLTLGRTDASELLINGPQIRELSLRYFLQYSRGDIVWWLPKVESLYLEDLETLVVMHLLRSVSRQSTISKVELRKMTPEALKAIAEQSGGSIQELVVDWGLMWNTPWADRIAVLRQMTSLRQLNGYAFKARLPTLSGCVIS
ncbi:hypothetical protein EC991_010568 [Linnemannia zychae]|nr:hypothetical protein EC991_010568 [Linnemannia zychae]